MLSFKLMHNCQSVGRSFCRCPFCYASSAWSFHLVARGGQKAKGSEKQGEGFDPQPKLQEHECIFMPCDLCLVFFKSSSLVPSKLEVFNEH